MAERRGHRIMGWVIVAAGIAMIVLGGLLFCLVAVAQHEWEGGTDWAGAGLSVLLVIGGLLLLGLWNLWSAWVERHRPEGAARDLPPPFDEPPPAPPTSAV